MAGTKLELTWIGKGERPRLEPRILLEDPEKSHHAAARRSDTDIFENMLIHGDNLLALRALEQEFTGKVKCIYIDPPYNTGSAFEHYDDGIEHSLWLTLMRDRLELLHRLLREDGSLWVTLDDNESHYFKVMCDEVFGRKNFIANVIWQKKFSPQNDAKFIDADHDHILFFAKDREKLKTNLLERTDAMNARYKNPDNDPRGPWTPGDALRKEYREYAYFSITTPSGREVVPPPGSSWRFNKEDIPRLLKENRLWFGKDGSGVPRIKRFLSDVKQGLTPLTIWPQTEAGNTQEAKKETIAHNPECIFDTPKPERLIQRILHIATNPGDLVLDSFLGSGTTAAVAHKMGRRWIGVELGEHCYTHCLPRLKKVVDGEDPGGISKDANWKGGGGFRFYELGPTLIKKDAWGMEIINPCFNPEMLAEAMCRLMGYRYAPDADCYWKHGQATERDFLYVTTQFLTREALTRLSADAGECSLLICCGGSAEGVEIPANLTVRKIPQAVLDKCEWDRDDYSLEIRSLPLVDNTDDSEKSCAGSTGTPAGGRRKTRPAQGSLI